MKRTLPIALTCSAVLLGGPVRADSVPATIPEDFYDEIELDSAGQVRPANDGKGAWDALAIDELIGLLDAATTAPDSVELGELTGGSWSGGTAWRIAPDALTLAQPFNVEVTLRAFRDGEDALGFYTESGDAGSGAVIFDDLADTDPGSYVRIGSIKDDLYFSLLEAEGGSAFEVDASSEFDADDYLMYAITGNRYLFLGIDDDADDEQFLDMIFKVEVGVANATALIASAAPAGPEVAAVPLPPAAWGAVGVLGLLLRRRLRRS
jgi:hypothetical protein